MKIAQAILKEKYNDITLEIAEEEHTVTVKWKSDLPPICTEEMIQERKNGKLFFEVTGNKMTNALRKIEKGANVNAQGPFERTPLYAVMREPQQLEKLIAKGARVNVVDQFGMSPLDIAKLFAESSGNDAFVSVLHQNGAKTGNEIRGDEIRTLKRPRSPCSESEEERRMIEHLTSKGSVVSKKQKSIDE